MRRALMAVCFGLVLGVAVGVIAAGSLNPESTTVLASISAVVAVPAAVLGWLLFIPGRMAVPGGDADRGRGQAQRVAGADRSRSGGRAPRSGAGQQWSDRATAGAWRDTMIITALVLAVVAFAGFQWPTSYVLLGVLVLGITAQGIRQVLVSQGG